jgi:serine/threonine-protein kinase RsbW
VADPQGATPYPRVARWRHVWVVAAILAIGLALALVVRSLEQTRDREARERTIDRVVDVVERASVGIDAVAVAAPGIVGPDGAFVPEGFADVAQPLADASGAALVAWVEVVPRAERATWESTWARPVVELGTGGPGWLSSSPSPDRERHLVVTDVYPESTLFAALRGIDLASAPEMGAAADAAIAEGTPRASPPFELATGGRGFLVAVPVMFADGQVSGLVVSFRTAEALGTQIADVLPSGGTGRVSDGGTVLIEEGPSEGSVSTRVVDVIGRPWAISVQAPPGSREWPVVLVAAGVLAVAVALLLIRSRRDAEVREALFDAERDARAQADSAQAALAISDNRFRALLEAITKIVFIADPGGSMVRSESWEAFTGQSADEYCGEAQGGFDAIHPDERQAVRDGWAEAIARRGRFDAVYRLLRADGEYRRVTVAAIPLLSEGGEVREWVGAIADVEDRLRAEERAKVISQNAARLALAGDIHDVAAATLADLGGFGVAIATIRLLQDGRVRVLGTVGVSAATMAEFDDIPLEVEPTLAREAMLTGEPVVVESAAEVAERFPGAVRLAEESGAETAACFPMRTSTGAVIGALTVGSTQQRWVTDEVREVVGGLAEQTGLALERARLQGAVAVASERATFLAALADALDRRVSVRDRAEESVSMISARWGLAAAVCLRGDDDELEVVATSSPWVDFDLGSLADGGRGDPGPPAGDTGRLVLPLVARGHELGLLVLDRDEPGRDEGSLDAVLVSELTSRIAVALDNARMYEHERDVSHALQVGLLSGSLHQVDGVLVSTSYRPGTVALEVGGDWYDVFRLADGHVALVVGDVVGHGLDAAVAMGQLRGAVRALAPGSTPAEMLSRLDAFVAGLASASMATLAYADLDPVSGSMRFACAGHPPPLVRRASGDADLVWDGRSTPLGVTFGTRRVDAVLQLGPGDALVLYTDGLVERRDRSIDDRLARLAGAVADLDVFDGTYAERLADEMLGADVHDDDACVLAVQLAPLARQFAHPLVASPAEVGALRRRLAPWLERHGVGRETTQTVLLAVSEAVANALEHGYGFDGLGVTTVDALLVDGHLRVTVRDEGRWKEPQVDTDRGRGTPIMHTLMDEVTVEAGPTGTTVTMTLRLTSVQA